MELYIYSDESGVFDKMHNDYYVYGGLIFTDKAARDTYGRKYLGAEKNIAKRYPKGIELKAARLSNNDKNKLYKVVKPCIKFGAVVYQQTVLDSIFSDKKSKQRYLDFVYKLALKNALLNMERDGLVSLAEIVRLNVSVDEHTTATNGRYELRESLLQEFKHGTYNYNYSTHYPSIISNLQDVRLQYCNSAKQPLIRAADIVANRLYYVSVNGITADFQSTMYIKNFPN